MNKRRVCGPMRSPLKTRLWLVAVLSLYGCDADLGSDQNAPTEDAEAPSYPGETPETSIDNEAWSEKPEIDPFLPLIRRLTRDEIKYTALDVLNVALTDDELSVVPGDRPLEGFVNVATSQTVLPEHVQGYSDLAETVAAKLDWNAKLTAWGGCSDLTATCQESLVESLGAELFRRPPNDAEIQAFGSLFATVLAEDGADFELGARAVLRAMMQSPQFLYRIELETAAVTGLSAGEAKTVVGYEMATRLSYLLWASAPDQELYEAAKSGALDTAADIVTQVARLLQDSEKSRRVTDRYMVDWGRLEALPDDGGLKAELIESVVATYSNMLWDQAVALTDVYAANELLLTPALAEGYGLTPTGDAIATYDVSELPGRIGLLTHPGLIAGMTNADGGAIVARGLFLQTQLFCRDTPSPPAGLQEAIDEFLAEQPENASDRLIAETRLERQECGNCHGGFDPLAYGLEQFDYQGRFRTEDEFGNGLSTDGWIPDRVRLEGPDLPYETIEDLAMILANEPAVHQCVTEQHLKYALGRTLANELTPLIEQVYGAFSSGGGTYQAMLDAIVTHDLFRKMKVE